MRDIRQVLIATDFSEPASFGETRGALLARTLHASLQLLHVVVDNASSRLYPTPPPAANDLIMASVRQELDARANLLERTFGLSVQRHISSGRPANEILRIADDRQCDLVVASAHGKHLVHELLFGSTTECLLYRSERPLLIVKRLAHDTYRRVLAAVDFSDCSLAAAKLATRLAPDADLYVFHAVQTDSESMLRFAGVAGDDIERDRRHALEERRQEMDRFMAALAPSRAVSAVGYGHTASAVEKELEGQKSDLLVMGKRGFSVIKRFFVGSFTTHLARTAQCDVLIVPDAR
jgi:nucleotide-binding universal stress UspA family protein